MIKFLDQYADLTAFFITVLAPLICAIYLKIKMGKRVRVVPLYLFFFGPCGILSFIFFHLIDNSTRAITNALYDKFTYNFHFYSLILMGIVVAYLGYLYLRACYYKAVCITNPNKPVFKTIGLIAITTIPLIPIIPIAAVPMICIGFSLLGLPFVRRKIRNASIVSVGQKTVITA